MILRDAVGAGSVQCPYCDHGFTRLIGLHVPGKHRGAPSPLIAPCERVFAAHVGNATELNIKPYLAYVDGETLKDERGVPRRFSTAATAYRAAQRVAPFRE